MRVGRQEKAEQQELVDQGDQEEAEALAAAFAKVGANREMPGSPDRPGRPDSRAQLRQVVPR